jgi:chromatin remodeling complex protein RSC6
MKRSTTSKSASVASQKSSEQVVQTPVVQELPQKQQPVEQPVKPVSKRTKKVKEAPLETVDVIPSPSAPPSTPSVSKASVSEIVVGGEHTEAELSSAPADEFDVRSSEYFNALRDLVNKATDLKNEYKAIERLWARRLKTVTKSGKRKKAAGTRAPSGFVKPTLISAELALFLGKEPDTKMARTEVTREINVYIRNHGLQDSQNGRRINADAPLSALLRLDPTSELTYFNLQTYLSSHFPKAPKVSGETA